MKLSNEAKVGLIGIVTISVLIWGINYLKGRNILSSTYTLHAFYMDSGGLESSSPILLNGVKIGYVDEIRLRPQEKSPIELLLSIEKNYPLPKGARAVQASTDLLGTKAIKIELQSTWEEQKKPGYYTEDDTILSAIEPDMISSFREELIPVANKISDLALSMDHLVQQMDTLLISQTTVDILKNLSEVSKSLSLTMKPGGTLNQSLGHLESFSSMLEGQEDNLTSLITHLNSLSMSLDSAGIDKLSFELRSVAEQFNLLFQQINSGEGTTGKLIYSDSLYRNLDVLISDLDTLIKDLNENPGDYVHISVFGKSKKK